MSAAAALRLYEAADEDAAVALWLTTWQTAFPAIDFAARLDWWRARWRNELAATALIVVAERDRALIGFVTLDPRTRYLDQIVVAPQCWGSGVATALLGEAQRACPHGIELDVNTDNARAIAFYKKRGFAVTGDGKNPWSGRPVYRMSWRP